MRLPDLTDPLGPIRRLREWLGDAGGRTTRRTTVVDNRAHIEVRGGLDPSRSDLHASVKRALERLGGVDWAEVDAVVGRVVVVFDPGAVELDDLISTVEDVEEAHGAEAERFPHAHPDHPADPQPIQRHLYSLGADVAGLGVATAGQTLRLARIPAEVPGLISLADGQVRVRRLMEDRLGPPATEVVVASASAMAQALGQGPVGLLVDIAHQSAQIAEQMSRRRAWQRREPELIQGPWSVRHGGLSLPERPVELPKGPVERYADGAAIASMGAIGVTLGATRNPRRAADQVLLAVPKAATLGREVFAAVLGVILAQHDVLVMDRTALRRLDRASTLVIDARLFATGRWAVDRLEIAAPDADETSCAAHARALLDPSDPGSTQRRGSWVLTPWHRDERAPRGSEARARRLRRGGRRALALWHGDQLAAIVAVAEEPAALASDLVAEAHRSGLEVFLAGGPAATADQVGAEHWAASNVVDEIRDCQAAGGVVVYASGRAHGGLSAADIGVGLETPGHRAPLGAHIVIRAGLGQAWLVLSGIRSARAASSRSVLLASAGTGAGAFWGMLGSPGTAARRTMLAVNASALASMANGAVAGLRAGVVTVPVPPPRHRWHELEGARVLELVGSSADGLDGPEQDLRRRTESARPVREPVGLLQAAVGELANPLTPVLVLGATLSAAVGSLTDAGLVLGVLGVNSLVGATQRVQTERALHDLEDGEVPSISVLVAGTPIDVPSDLLVVGDVIMLEAGAAVPADCRLLASETLEVDESSLTGESLPVVKSPAPTMGAGVPDRASMVYEGTVVSAGSATAVVVAVGIATEAGRSFEGAAAPPPSGVERRLQRLTNLTVPVTVGAGVLTTGLSFLYRRPVREAVGTGVSLMVAAVPEGLPALATLAQVASARRLASRKALVRNPHAIEALGRVSEVCFDKTGTLTEGRLSLVLVTDGTREDRIGSLTPTTRDVLAAARKATPPTNGDAPLPHATDRSIATAADAVGLDDRSTGWVRLNELPFESQRSLHAVLGRVGRTRSVVVKGAPEVVLPRCESWQRDGRVTPLDPEAARLLEEQTHDLGRRGLRVLAVASGRVSAGAELGEPDHIPPLTFLGFVALADPVRPTAVAAVQTLQGAGVHLAMITGDHPSTAEAIAVELGMLNGGRIVTGRELDELDDEELDRVIGDVAVFARVTPLQKVRIVASHQRCGRAVAMTGDGANDAAAIRLADAGIALGGRGTDAARANADVVVVDDRIETIVDAVVEGRAMWESVRAAVAILVGGNLGEVGFTLAGTAFGGSAPLNPRQLLLVNLLTDMAPALAIALREPADRSPESLLRAGPDTSLGLALSRDILVRAGATAGGATGAWAVARLTGTPTRARTVGLTALIGTQLAQTVVAGGLDPGVLLATGVSVGVLVLVVQTPGLSQFFGCRPLGPVGWSIAGTATAYATTASIVVPWATERVGTAIIGAIGGVGDKVASLHHPETDREGERGDDRPPSVTAS